MSKKRANGEGSVYKTKDGRVIGSWQDANGRTRYMTSKTMTKREMSKAVRKKLQERDPSDPSNLDDDNDGQACETYDYGTTSSPAPTTTSSPAPSSTEQHRRYWRISGPVRQRRW